MFLLLSEKGNRYVVKAPGRYVFEEGVVVVSSYGMVVSSKGVRFNVVKPTFRDLFEKEFKRGAQIIHEKDLGYIMRRLSISNDAVLLEAGTGSGHATVFLSRLFKEVHAYEKEARFFEITKGNVELFGVENVILHNNDVASCSNKDYYDAVLFDFKEAHEEKYINHAHNLLKPGGFIVLYFPVIEQVQSALHNLNKAGFKNISVREIMLREWKLNPLRPQTKMLAHTAFIVEARKF